MLVSRARKTSRPTFGEYGEPRQVGIQVENTAAEEGFYWGWTLTQTSGPGDFWGQEDVLLPGCGRTRRAIGGQFRCVRVIDLAAVMSYTHARGLNQPDG